MTEEDKKAIEYLNKDLKKADMLEMTVHTDNESLRTALNLIQSQQEEIFVKEHINGSFKLMINERDKKIVEMSNCIDKLKSKNKELLRKLRSRVKEVKKLTKYSLYKQEFSRLNKQLEKKDKIMDLMGYAMTHEEVPINEYCVFRDISCEIVGGNKECKDCIKQYFEKKVEGK